MYIYTYMCVCVCIYIYIHIYSHTYIYTTHLFWILAIERLGPPAGAAGRLYICMYISMYISISNTHTYDAPVLDISHRAARPPRRRDWPPIYIYMYIYIYIYTYKYT